MGCEKPTILRGSEGAATLVSATYAASTAAPSRSKVTGFGSSLAASSKASAILVFAIGSSGSIQSNALAFTAPRGIDRNLECSQI